MKKLEIFTECPKQRFPGDRRFKSNDNPMNDKGNNGKESGKK